MVSKTFGCSVYGVDAIPITVEVNVTSGTKFYLAGLPDNAIKESQHRVESALKTAGFYFPRNKVIVNLAPADIRKEGSAFDLNIAIGVLASSGQIDSDKLDKYMMMGELSLDGQLRPIRGVLPIAIEARKEGFKGFIVPKENAEEASIVNELDIIGVSSLKEAIQYLEDKVQIKPTVKDTREIFYAQQDHIVNDFSDVQGHEAVKRALEVAAAGGHNVIMIGPPGSGKTMLAKRMPTILPPLTLAEALETTKIYSVSGKLSSTSLVAHRPFSSPHHTVSDVALVGGGNIPQPGLISLAHNGILFLDELPEFKRTVLEVLRQPLEERVVTISRAKATVKFPANFMLVASMNPSPSGDFYTDDGSHPDSPAAVQKYLSKVSGPLMDRIDIHIEVNPVSFDEMTETRKEESSADVRERVIAARGIQLERFKDRSDGIHSNSMMPPQLVKEICEINTAGKALLKAAMDKLGLSSRAYDRILKVSRTIADLAGKDKIAVEHLAEAIQYRSLDRESWLG